jgi:RsiW-degrading membrane proteinase PrsW (M82 family)
MPGWRLSRGRVLMRGRSGGGNVSFPSHADIWSENRDAINLVSGAILGAYLGFSVSKEGLAKGSQWDLLALILFTAYAVSALITFGNRWFCGNRKLAIGFLFSAAIPFLLSVRSAGNLGVNQEIFMTIYAAWMILVLTQVIAHWASERAKQAMNE